MRGFIYVVTTVGKDYQQSDCRRDVPTVWEDRLVFGPCKVNMRPKMNLGDYIFGISPSGAGIRRIVFAAKITEVLRFEDASIKYQEDWTASGITPICVKPVSKNNRIGMFPISHYDHLVGAKHTDSWKKDIPTKQHDRCFICEPVITELPWLGGKGPATSGRILNFLKSCELWGSNIHAQLNGWATEVQPIIYQRDELGGRLYTGLHLETDKPEQLVNLIREFAEEIGALKPQQLAVEGRYVKPRGAGRCR